MIQRAARLHREYARSPGWMMIFFWITRHVHIQSNTSTNRRLNHLPSIGTITLELQKENHQQKPLLWWLYQWKIAALHKGHTLFGNVDTTMHGSVGVSLETPSQWQPFSFDANVDAGAACEVGIAKLLIWVSLVRQSKSWKPSIPPRLPGIIWSDIGGSRAKAWMYSLKCVMLLLHRNTAGRHPRIRLKICDIISQAWSKQNQTCRELCTQDQKTQLDNDYRRTQLCLCWLTGALHESPSFLSSPGVQKSCRIYLQYAR